MTSQRRTIVLACVAGALALSYAVGLLANRVPPAPVVVARFEASAARRIAAGPTVLQKKDGGWQESIDGNWYPADTRKVESLLHELSGMRAGRIAATSRSDWPAFKVGPADAVRLSVESNAKRLVDLYIGKTSADGGVYLRSGTKPTVYEAFTNVDALVSADPSYWSHLQILPATVTVDSLQTISITAHGFTVGGESVSDTYFLEASVVNGKSAWVVNGKPSDKLDQQKVLSLEAEIVRMEGDRFATGKTVHGAGLDHPQADIAISDQRGATWSIEVGNRYGAQFFVKRSDLPYIYLVNEWTLHRAIPRLDSLLVSSPRSSRAPG